MLRVDIDSCKRPANDSTQQSTRTGSHYLDSSEGIKGRRYRSQFQAQNPAALAQGFMNQL